VRRCIFCQFDNPPEATVCAACGRQLLQQGPAPAGFPAMSQPPVPPQSPSERPLPPQVYPQRLEAPAPAPGYPRRSAEPLAFPETAPGGIRYVAGLCFFTSMVSLLTALVSSEYRHQLTVLGERMGGVNGPFLVFLSLLTLLAGIGLVKYWSGGWNLAVLAGVMGLIAGGVKAYHGGRGIVLGVLLIALCLVAVGYLFYGPVIIWFREGPKFTTSDYRRPSRDLLTDVLRATRGAYGTDEVITRQHDLLNYLGMALLAAYGIVYAISLLGPAREFTSEEYRFKISAPPGWVVADAPQTGAVVSLVRPDRSGSVRNQPCVSVYVQASASASDDLSAEETTAWEQDWMRQAGLVQYPAREAVSVAGLMGWKIILERPRSGADPERWMLVALKREGRTFTLRCATDASVFDETLPECNVVLEQFRFLP